MKLTQINNRTPAPGEPDLILIKQQLLSGRRITVQTVLTTIGTQELRSYIPILRRAHGLDIETAWQRRDGKRFKEYFLKAC